MKYWVQYHNYDKLGYVPGNYPITVKDLSRLDTSTFEVSCITTSKRTIQDAVGDTVFLIVGYGDQPKKYVLWSSMTIETCSENSDGTYDAFGTGQVLNPPALLSGREFDEFKRQNGNFGLGFQNVSGSPFLSTLIQLARSADARV